MRKRKIRFCKVCGNRMEQWNLMICDDCRAAGFSVPAGEEVRGEELLEVAVERERSGMKILEGMRMEDIALLAREHGANGYRTYGKFKAYCDMTGRLPPK